MPLRIRIRLPGRRAAGAVRRPDAVPVRFVSDAVRFDETASEAEEGERRRRLHRFVRLAAPGGIFAVGTALAIFGQGGCLDLRSSLAEEAALQVEVQSQFEKTMLLKAEVARLRADPAQIERIAREQLGYAGEGEIQFLLPPDPDDPEEPDLGAGLPRPARPDR